MRHPLVSIVVPAYNESARLPGCLSGLVDYVDPTETEIIVVDDGSSDGTAKIAQNALQDGPPSRVLRFEHNRGKGAAVRAGVLAAQGDAVMYMDADVATDLEDLEPLLAALDDADFAVGSRTAAGARVLNRTTGRALRARCFNTIARPITGLPIRDTQCGFKALRASAAKCLFGLATIDGFAFDVEIVALARKLGLRIAEVPVTWTAVPGGSVRVLQDPARMALDAIRIAWRWRGSRAYETGEQTAPRAAVRISGGP